jgi:hypothetical protein
LKAYAQFLLLVEMHRRMIRGEWVKKLTVVLFVIIMRNAGMERWHSQFSDSPARLAWLEAYLSRPSAARPVLAAVDDSTFSLGQWIDAFIQLEQWLEAQGRRASFDDQLGYVHCACEAAGNGANLTTLAAVVAEMLDDYGFEHSQRKDEH